MENKKPWQSKTMIMNLIIGVIMAVSPFLPAAMGVKAFLDAHMAIIGTVWAAAGMALRLITSGAITLID